MQEISQRYKNILELIFEKGLEKASNFEYEYHYINNILMSFKVDLDVFEKAFNVFEAADQLEYLDSLEIIEKNGFTPDINFCRRIIQHYKQIPGRLIEACPDLISDVFLLQELPTEISPKFSILSDEIQNYINENLIAWFSNEKIQANLHNLKYLVTDLSVFSQEFLIKMVELDILNLADFRRLDITKELYRLFAWKATTDELRTLLHTSIPEEYLPIHWALLGEEYQQCSQEILKEFIFLATHTSREIRDWFRTHYYDKATITILDGMKDSNEKDEFTVPVSFAHELKVLLNAYENDYEFLEKMMKSAGFFNRVEHLEHFQPKDFSNMISYLHNELNIKDPKEQEKIRQEAKAAINKFVDCSPLDFEHYTKNNKK